MKEEAHLHNEHWRVFCAIEMPEPVRHAVLQHIARLKEAVPDVKATWSRDANLHLTLKFLGEIPRTSVPDISTAASQAVAGMAPFSIRLEQTGAFAKDGQPRVLWVGINDSSRKLSELQARLEEEAANAGFVKESRPFHPHLTVSRLRQPRHARTLAATHRQLEFEPADIAVAELLVVRSELSSEGSKYTVISRHGLG
jgi:RNA 2',3'-cyclic 3'-phosphodiesterase